MPPAPHNLSTLATQFQFEGSFLAAEPFGAGHINDTFRLTYLRDGAPIRYLLQRINAHVFHDPPAVMENIARVTAHLVQKFSAQPNPHRHVAAIIPTRNGGNFHRDHAGNFWRAQTFVENAHTLEIAGAPAQAYQAARAFARFQTLLADLPPPRLHDTIPDFHNTPSRFADLRRAIDTDPLGRAMQARAEIDFALAQESIVGSLTDAGLPERVTHNDTKLNNVLSDDDTGEAICVIDLDTVMPGLAPYDFGDMVRSMTSPAAEDEPDPAKVVMRIEVFEAIARGYLSHASNFLTDQEKDCLVTAGKVITLENGFRFLADFLQGDTYYRTTRPNQNLDRAHAQFALVQSIIRQEASMQRLVNELWRN